MQGFYVCSDMAADVWNMLQAQGINALIQIGDVDKSVTEIAQCSHAWVLVEISPGEYLTVEATGGYVVPRSENDLYYQGWSFANPRDLKRYQELRREWNLRVDIINLLVDKADTIYAEYEEEYADYSELVEEYNSKYSSSPDSSAALRQEIEINTQLTVVKEKEGKYSQLSELVDEQNGVMESLDAEMRGLVTEW